MKDQGILKKLISPTHSILGQIPRALVVSALAAVLDVGILILLVEVAGWSPLVAAVISYLLGGILQYILSSIWVFPYAPRSAVLGFVALSLLSLGGLLITWATMWLLYDTFGLYYLIAKGVALLLSFCWNFLSRKYWLFRPR